MANANRSRGPIQTGSLRHGVAFDTIPAVRYVPISADGTYHTGVLPACEIIDAFVVVHAGPLIAVTSGAEVVTVRFGTTADETALGTYALSAAAKRVVGTTNVSAANWKTVVSGTSFVVDVTTVATANALTGAFCVVYRQSEQD
jgi:hypothetical protein